MWNAMVGFGAVLAAAMPPLWAGAAAAAEPGPRQQTPASAARERLAFLEGTWTRPDLPAGQTFRETCAWMPGGHRHMVCRQRTDTADGSREQMLVYSYRGADATFTVTAFLAGGQVWNYEGGPDGDRWIFTLIPRRPERRERLRQVLTPGANEIRFREEVSENGGPWRLTDPSEAYRHVRVGGGVGVPRKSPRQQASDRRQSFVADVGAPA